MRQRHREEFAHVYDNLDYPHVGGPVVKVAVVRVGFEVCAMTPTTRRPCFLANQSKQTSPPLVPGWWTPLFLAVNQIESRRAGISRDVSCPPSQADEVEVWQLHASPNRGQSKQTSPGGSRHAPSLYRDLLRTHDHPPSPLLEPRITTLRNLRAILAFDPTFLLTTSTKHQLIDLPVYRVHSVAARSN